ncbi:MAG: c-type cytochrome [Cyanophyceae cyanobacterium]
MAQRKQLTDQNILGALSQVTVAVIAIVLIALVIVLGIHVYRRSNPYIQEVLSLSGDVQRGHQIFQINCAGCHGLQADGNVGPSLQDIHKRKSKVGLIEQVVSGRTPPMPKFQPNSQEMADLLSYLEKL